jgi:hypothetical protein
MAAGGFKEFVAGEVLDEDEINDFLMQGVLVFAGTAARGSAITSPVEGQFSFLADSDSVEFYDGSAWVAFSGAPPLFTYLVIGAGGGGGTGANVTNLAAGGGGGAGGYRCNVTGENTGGGLSAETALLLESGSYTVTIGAGGTGAVAADTNGTQGGVSVFASVRSYGGGGGSKPSPGFFGGSGSGAGAQGTPAGLGLSGQGSNGGVGANSGGGGGGGASAVGQAGTTDNGGDGGAGVSSSITGSSVGRAGGGGGGSNSSNPGGDGTQGGGTGGNQFTNATAGTVNTGGGGGGGRIGNAANGGSGVVILKYPDSITLTIGGGLTSSTSTAGGFKTTTFTAGTDTVSF